ncbi:terminase small subunit (plasmid) [Clostridium perfringens]
MGISNKGGRPLKFKSPEELQNKIDAYYEWAKENKKHITVTGLAWFLDTNRQTLLDYESEDSSLFKTVPIDVRGRFIDAIKKAKARIEMEYEESLYNKNSAVGAIFTLKNNYNYVDKQEVAQKVENIEVKLGD